MVLDKRSVEISFDNKWILEWKEGEDTVRTQQCLTLIDTLTLIQNDDSFNWLFRINN